MRAHTCCTRRLSSKRCSRSSRPITCNSSQPSNWSLVSTLSPGHSASSAASTCRPYMIASAKFTWKTHGTVGQLCTFERLPLADMWILLAIVERNSSLLLSHLPLLRFQTRPQDTVLNRFRLIEWLIGCIGRSVECIQCHWYCCIPERRKHKAVSRLRYLLEVLRTVWAMILVELRSEKCRRFGASLLCSRLWKNPRIRSEFVTHVTTNMQSRV